MKKLVLAAVILLVLVLCACGEKHYNAENIGEKFDSEWIIGRTRGEIERKYGSFDREFVSNEGKNLGAFYVNYDNGPLDASYIHDTYFVEFDENGKAVAAYFRETSKGG